MKKIFKFIIFPYLILMFGILIFYILIPVNPIDASYRELIGINNTNSEFNLYESEYIKNHNLRNYEIKGNLIGFYEYNLELVKPFNRKYYDIIEQENDSNMKGYYFKDNNIILVKSEIKLSDIINNNYYFSLILPSNSKVLSSCVSYTYGNSSFSINTLSNITSDSYLRNYNIHDFMLPKLNSYSSIHNLTVTISFFIDLNQTDLEKLAIIFSSYKEIPYEIKTVNLGFSFFKYYEYLTPIFNNTNPTLSPKNYYIQFGGKE